MAIIVAILALLRLAGAHPAHAASGRWLWYAGDSGWRHAHVALLATGPHVSVYAEPGSVSRHDARMVADAFSWRIYPTDVSTFGYPQKLGPVTIALLPLGGITLGYFNEDDLAPNRPGADASHSNHGNVLYVRTPETMPDATRLADVGEVVAHEFQHLIDFRIRVLDHHWLPEDDWLNEGLSVYAQFANHYFTERDVLKVQAAAADPGWNLTNLNSANASIVQHSRAAYGRAGLFVTYLTSRFGSSIARDIIATRQTGITGVSRVLAHRHSSLHRVFSDWSVASLLDQPGKYGYGSAGAMISRSPRALAPPVSSSDLPYGSVRNEVMAPWTQQYLTLGPSAVGTLVVKLSGSVTHISAAVVLPRNGYQAGSDVRWLAPDYSGNLVARIKSFGLNYARATVVLADTSPGAATSAIRISANLVNVGNDNRVSRPAPPARNHVRRPIRHISHIE